MIQGGWLEEDEPYSIEDMMSNIDMPHDISVLETAVPGCKIRVVQEGIDIGYGPKGNEGPIFIVIVVDL